MKIQLTGSEVENVRTAFGLSAEAFALVLAVHPATVRRWEASGAAPVSIDGVAAGVLTVARERLQRTPPPTPEELRKAGNAVVATLAAAGALLALVALIEWLTSDSGAPGPRGGKGRG